MMQTRRLAPLLLFLLAAGAQEPPPQIDWVGDWEAAFKQANETGKPVMVCINSKDGEKANERAARTTYHDAEFVALSRKFVMLVLSVRSHATRGTCPRFGRVTCEQHLNCWKELRARHGQEFMASAMSGEMISPQHAWFRPDGTLLRRKEYELTKAELMERMRRVLDEVARKKEDPGGDEAGAGEPGESVPEAADPRNAPLDDKDRAELERLTKADREGRRAALSNLLATEKIAAHEALVELLDETRDTAVECDILRALGRANVVDAREVIEHHLKDRDDLVRSFAAVALEELGRKESVPALLKRARSERDTQARKNMYRALGACGGPGADKGAASFLLKRIDSDRQNANKKHAALSLRHFTTDDGKKLVLKRLERMAGRSKDPYVRGGIVYTLTKIGDVETTLPVFEKILEDVNTEYGRYFMLGAIRTLKGEGEGFGRSGRFLFAEDRDDPARED
jgi:hypothetical protein